MILAQVRKLLQLHPRAAKCRREQFECLLHVPCERAESCSCRNGSRVQPTRVQGHHRMHETVRACQQHVQLVHLRGRSSRFRAQPVDGGFQVRACHACAEPRAIEFARAVGFVPHVGLREAVKIFPVSIQHFGNPLGNLGPLPGRPDPIREKRERAACRRVDSARPDHFFRRDSGDGEQKNHQSESARDRG